MLLQFGFKLAAVIKFLRIFILYLCHMGCGVSSGSGSGRVSETRDVSEQGDEDSNLDFRFYSVICINHCVMTLSKYVSI